MTANSRRHVLKLNCSTCGKTDITAWEDHVNDCPGLGEIVVRRERGRGVIVDHAPPRALIGLHIIRDLAWPANIAGVGDPDLINIADQALYRVVGYDPGMASLVVELVEDWRPNDAPDEEEDEEPVGPAKPGIPRCTATWKTERQGTARCWRRAVHNQREGYEAHMGETEQGYCWQWIGTEPGATPHQPGPEPADAAVCTPIPAATLQQMSEVPPELLVEQQRTRADNAEERLRFAREALARDRYFTADEIGDDIAPRIAELSKARVEEIREVIKDRALVWQRAVEAEVELARLHAGEEPGWDPLTVPTPGQWIARWNSLEPAERLQIAQDIIDSFEVVNRCRFEGHLQRLDEDRKAWVKVARVRDVIADMEGITGARHWARILRTALNEDEPHPQDTTTKAIEITNPRNTGWYWVCGRCGAEAGKFTSESGARQASLTEHPQCPPDPYGPYAWTIPAGRRQPTPDDPSEPEPAPATAEATAPAGCPVDHCDPDRCGVHAATECSWRTAPQVGPDPTGFTVQPYHDDRNQLRWVFRCWGTDDGCDGWLSLDHTSQESAERARDLHIAEEHPMPACTATIVEPHTGSDTPVPCAFPVHGSEQQHESAPEGPTRRRLHWTDHHAGATPHEAASEEPTP